MQKRMSGFGLQIFLWFTAVFVFRLFDKFINLSFFVFRIVSTYTNKFSKHDFSFTCPWNPSWYVISETRILWLLARRTSETIRDGTNCYYETQLGNSVAIHRAVISPIAWVDIILEVVYAIATPTTFHERRSVQISLPIWRHFVGITQLHQNIRPILAMTFKQWQRCRRV